MKLIYIFWGLVVLVLIGSSLVWLTRGDFREATRPEDAGEDRGVKASGELPLASDLARAVSDVEVVAQGLEIPWEIAWLPDGDMLVTERPGRLVRIREGGRAVISVEGVAQEGEGGLLGMALHPDFADNQWIYLYLTARSGGELVNRVERYRLLGDRLSDRQVILDGIAGSEFHDGGRIGFGPDGYLYVTVGDAGRAEAAQDKDSLNGKILRLRDDGSSPDDNPFGNPVYSYGHRNAQGLAWDDGGRLWSTEHGRSGLSSGLDEINLIEPGKNYGWPAIEGQEKLPGLEAPAANSGAKVTWAPAGAAWLEGRLFFAGLRGESLYEAKIDGSSVVSVVPRLRGQFGRLRSVRVGPDGWLYLTTSNRDGRGQMREGDDKVIRVNPALWR